MLSSTRHSSQLQRGAGHGSHGRVRVGHGRRSLLACQAAQQPQDGWVQRLLDNASLGVATVATAALIATSLPTEMALTPPAEAMLTKGDPIKNAQTLLRNALPIDDVPAAKPLRQIQADLESISASLRIPGQKSLGPVSKAVNSASARLTKEKAAIVKAFAPDKVALGTRSLASLETSLAEFKALIEAKDKQAVPIKQREALSYLGGVEEALVQGFPFEVPKEYADRPLLLGRANLEMKVTLNETQEGKQDAIMDIVLDGYNAPVSAGQFMDLVLRKFYDGMEIQRADGFVVQTGDPEGPAEGFVDPKTGKVRRVPLEIRVQGDKAPIYEDSLEDLGRFNDQPALPFDAYGTIAMARGEFDNNSASSQIFFLLKESELTPSGANLLDGRYAVFGYVVKGQDYLTPMKVGDVIQYIKVTSGAELLKNGPSLAPPPAPPVAPPPAAVEPASSKPAPVAPPSVAAAPAPSMAPSEAPLLVATAPEPAPSTAPPVAPPPAATEPA